MLRNRPAAFLCLVFSAGIAAGLFLKYWAVLAFVPIAVVCLLAKKRLGKRFLLAFLTCITLLIGAVYTNAFNLITAAPRPDSDTVYSFKSGVLGTTVHDGYTRIELKVQDGDCAFDGKKMYMYCKDVNVKPCDLVLVSGSVSKGGLRAKSNGVDYVVYGNVKKLDGEIAKGLYYGIIRFRSIIGTAIENTFDGESYGFYRAVITSDRSKISVDTNASFLRSGIIHILSVSGQHFSLLVFGLYRFLMLLFKNKKACSAVCVFAAVFYALFTGLSPSVVRAAFMCCVIFATSIIKERGDSLISLSAILALMLVFQPNAIANTSLQLSFLATLGIILTLEQLDRLYEEKELKPALKFVLTPAVLSVSASLFCIPIYLLGFDYVSIISPVTNVLVNVLIGPAMVCGMVAVPLNAVGIEFFTYVPELLYSAILTVSDFCAGLRFSCFSLHLPYIWTLVIPSAVTAVIFAAVYVKKGLRLLLVSSLSTVALCFCCFLALQTDYNAKPLLYVYEEASSCYVLYAGNKSFVLIDGGGDESASTGASSKGCAFLDAYVVTDCTEDALARLGKTLPYLPAKTVYMPECESDSAVRIIDYCKSKGCNIKLYNADAGLYVSGVCIYGAYNDEDESAFIIKSAKHGNTVAVIGKSAEINENVWDASTLVITRACSVSPCGADLLPTSCDKAIIYKGDKSYLTSYITNQNVAKTIEKYKSGVSIRFDRYGVYEVIE